MGLGGGCPPALSGSERGSTPTLPRGVPGTPANAIKKNCVKFFAFFTIPPNFFQNVPKETFLANVGGGGQIFPPSALHWAENRSPFRWGRVSPLTPLLERRGSDPPTTSATCPYIEPWAQWYGVAIYLSCLSSPGMQHQQSLVDVCDEACRAAGMRPNGAARNLFHSVLGVSST